MEEVNFLHISDTHLCFEEDRPSICSSPERLERVYSAASRLDARPAFVLITGDFVHEGDAAAYAAAKTFVETMRQRYDLPTHVALGNHDRHEAFYRGYCETPAHTGPYYYKVKLPGLRLLVLDSAVDDQVPGRLDTEQLQWLEEQLKKSCPLPTVVALHHPPCGTTVHATNGNNLQQPDMFRHILERYPVKAVLAGHKHFATAAMLPGGTPAYTGAGVAFAIDMPQGGALNFVDGLQAQFCAVYDNEFYWSPFCLDERTVLARMTPRQMREYHAEK